MVVLFAACNENNGEDEPVFCTEDAKLCPDGSYVGRQGPDCEFAACPEVEDIPSDWENYSDDDLSFSYPSELGKEFIEATQWPPAVTVSEGIFSCVGEIHTVNGRDYCVDVQSEGAAGSTYNTYDYLLNLEAENSMLHVRFTLRFVQCQNYDEPERGRCENEQADFDLDALVDRIVATVEVLN